MYHATSNTGHVRLSFRREVSQDAIDAVLAALDDTPVGCMGPWTILVYPGKIMRFAIWSKLLNPCRCWLSAPKGRPPLLEVELLPDAAEMTPEQLMMTADLERVVAWALLD